MVGGPVNVGDRAAAADRRLQHRLRRRARLPRGLRRRRGSAESEVRDRRQRRRRCASSRADVPPRMAGELARHLHAHHAGAPAAAGQVRASRQAARHRATPCSVVTRPFEVGAPAVLMTSASVPTIRWSRAMSFCRLPNRLSRRPFDPAEASRPRDAAGLPRSRAGRQRAGVRPRRAGAGLRRLRRGGDQLQERHQPGRGERRRHRLSGRGVRGGRARRRGRGRVADRAHRGVRDRRRSTSGSPAR